VDIRDLILLADGGRTDVPPTRNAPDALRSVWHGKKAYDVLGAKRQLSLASSLGGEQEQKRTLASYLASAAGRHTVRGRASIEHAARQMSRERLTFLIVIDGKEVPSSAAPTADASPLVLGLVNERDFLRYSVTQKDASTASGMLHSSAAATEVQTIMTPLSEVVHVSLADSVSKCVDTFFERNLRHLPVIDGAHLSGILSLRDILRPIIDALEEEGH